MKDSGLHVLGIEITSRCNKNCLHCYAHLENRDHYISFTTIKKLLKEAKSMNVKEVIFTGGEPLLHPNFKRITDLTDEYPFKKILETNGSLISKYNRDLLKKFDLVQISFDTNYLGLKGGLRDGNLEEVKNAINLLKDNVKTQLYMTICKSNKSYIDLAIDWANKKGVSIGFNILTPTSKGKTLKQELFNRDDLRKIMITLCNLYNEKKISKPSHPQAIFFLEDKRKMALNANRTRGGCIAGIGACFISSQGVVFPCAFLRVSSGNFMKRI